MTLRPGVIKQQNTQEYKLKSDPALDIRDTGHIQKCMLAFIRPFKMFSRWFFANNKLIIMFRTSKFGVVM